MDSLFDPKTNQHIIDRIQKLHATSRPEWGKMTVSQMIVHCQRPFNVAFNELKLKRGLVGILFGGIAKKKLSSPQPFAKNLPTARSFIITGSHDFESEKNNLINLIRKFSQAGPSGITNEPHPFFGRMNAKEWDTLMFKHLDHHLRQFKV